MPGSKPACGSPGLIAACHALLRRLSRAIHQAAWQQAKALVFSIQLCRARIGNIIPSCLHPRFLHLGLHDRKSPKNPPLCEDKDKMGGDPAAGSPTATLLRLTRPCGAKARPSLLPKEKTRPRPSPTRAG